MYLITAVCFINMFTKERVNESAKENQEDSASKGDAVNPIVAVKALLTNKYWVIMFFAMGAVCPHHRSG